MKIVPLIDLKIDGVAHAAGVPVDVVERTAWSLVYDGVARMDGSLDYPVAEDRKRNPRGVK